MSFVDIDGVDLIYGDQTKACGNTGTLALSNASLSVARDEFVAIVGPSGCGKSTLLKLISGLVQSTRGIVHVDGREVRKPLKTVGMAFQSVTHELREAAFLADTVHVMSPRPGHVVVSSPVNFVRPRTLEMTFEADFVDLVHDCRHHISAGHAS